MRVTLKDIARETNLSVTTVSLVLNQKECRVSDSTRSLILKTAEKCTTILTSLPWVW